MQNYNEEEQVEDEHQMKQKYDQYFEAEGDEIINNLPEIDDEGSDSSDNTNPLPKLSPKKTKKQKVHGKSD